jgi:hypothetical protein
MSIINLTNHPSAAWGEEQKTAAQRYGEIIDLHFPDIGATLDETDIQRLAYDYVRKVTELHPQAVICQGEFTFVYAVVTELRKKGIRVLSACSERKAVEKFMPDGSVQKTAVFKFVRFREYTECGEGV